MPAKQYSYSEYRELVRELTNKNRTTGPEQSAERIDAAKLNAQRMKRIDKQAELRDDLTKLIQAVNKKWTWTVLIEAWCGDGAQNLPVIAKMSYLNPQIELRIILRDENLDIMDKYLTNGSRSIPILICTDPQGAELGTWGPRPKMIKEMAIDFKKNNPNISHDEFVKQLHLWYAKDKGMSIQDDFTELISKWKK